VKKNLSLRARVLLVFLSVVLLVIALFYGMNHFFWERVYLRSNVKVLRTTFEELSERVGDAETTDRDLIDYLVTAKEAQNINFALQGDTDWDFMVFTKQMTSPYEREFLLSRLQSNMLGQNTENTKVLSEGDRYRIQHTVLPDGEYLECYGYMTDAEGVEKKFILSMSLQKIINTSALSDSFFVYISLGLMVLGGLVIYWITNRITQPILQITELSKRMSELDFSARFTGGQHDEIGILGNNMNEMASQLERTILQLQMTNQELKKEVEEREHVDEMRKDFISNVSHELKTPIALIQGYAEGLKEFTDDPDSMAYYCDVICDEADKMNRMVKKLTTLNQLEFGSDGLDETAFDIMQMIRELVRNSGKMQSDHHASVSVIGPESCIVRGDEFKIEEVVNNYYSNAFNHLKEPNRITIFFDDLGPMIRISVRNTGEPIPEDELQKVWIKFYKVDKARTRAYGGSGIGLSIVKAIMEAHKRDFGVYNSPEGVTFWFELSKDGTELKAEAERKLASEENGAEITDPTELMNGEIVKEVPKEPRLTGEKLGKVKEI